MVSTSPRQRPRGRLAPSPTGAAHLGTARTALAVWCAARAAGGTLVWRLEDLDGPRVVPGAAAEAMRDLAWLGLDWDEGPDVGGAHGPYAQSERRAFYDRALERLAATGQAFPCTLSRSELRSIASAPHGPNADASPYPASLRPSDLPKNWLDRLRMETAATTSAAIRFKVGTDPVAFEDRVFGPRREQVDQLVGDFVLFRRDGMYSYQLAVVVDDIEMNIDEVVRGADLLDSTARQIQLYQALGAEPPSFAHVPLVKNSSGEKLSKRDGALSIEALRAAGVSAAAIVGWMACSLGLTDTARPTTPQELLDGFRWNRIRTEDCVLPDNVTEQLKRVG